MRTENRFKINRKSHQPPPNQVLSPSQSLNKTQGSFDQQNLYDFLNLQHTQKQKAAADATIKEEDLEEDHKDSSEIQYLHRKNILNSTARFPTLPPKLCKGIVNHAQVHL